MTAHVNQLNVAFKALAHRLDERQQNETPHQTIVRLEDVIHNLQRDLRIVTGERDVARSELGHAYKENEKLRAQLFKRSKGAVNITEGMLIDEVVNQRQAARLLGVPDYQISRWMKKGLFQTVKRNGRNEIIRSTLHIPPGYAPRKPKTQPKSRRA